MKNIPLTSEDNLHKAWLIAQRLKSGDSLKFTILRKGMIAEVTRTIP